MKTQKLILKELKKILLVLLFICASFSYNQKASAYTISKVGVEDSKDFVVEPGKTEVFLNPGETVTKYISVTNRTNRKLDFIVDIENMKGSESAETAVVLVPTDQDTAYPLHQYVDFEIDKFSLNFGEKITFSVTINVPSDIEPGGHYGAIIISNKSPAQFDASGNEVSGGAVLTSRIGSLILMRVNGDVFESGYLENFKVSGPKKFFHQKMPTSFDISYQNDGSVHLVPYGDIVIKNIFGGQIAQIPVDAYFILPDSLRNQLAMWPGKKLSFGYYTAQLNLYKGYGNEFENKKISFFVIPLMIVLPVIFVFLITFFALYFISKKYEFKRK